LRQYAYNERLPVTDWKVKRDRKMGLTIGDNDKLCNTDNLVTVRLKHR